MVESLHSSGTLPDLFAAGLRATGRGSAVLVCHFSRPVARARKAGVAHIRFHDLRHSHCAHLIAAGRNPKEISRRLGHASVSFTLDRYGHLMPDAGAQAAAAVAALVDGG